MEPPIHSRGTGRSGPKRKTGCLTCRRRKVRCDEAKPICANCIRLRLDCGYYNGRPTKLGRFSPSDDTPSSSTSHRLNGQRIPEFAPAPQLYQPSSSQTVPSTSTLPYGSNGQQIWNFNGEAAPGNAPPFQDIFFSSIDSFNTGLDFANSDAFLGPDWLAGSTGMLLGRTSDLPTTWRTDDDSPDDDRRKVLIDHFVQSSNPISVILPTHTEWTSACRSLLAMAKDSSFLLSAICALAALQLYNEKEEDTFDEAYRYYMASCRSVNTVLDQSSVDDRQLKQAFATLFLLSHVEVMAQSTSRAKEIGWPSKHLQSAHHRVRQHIDQIRLWTGISKRLLTWLTLLQTKAEYNTGYTTLEHSSSTLSKSTGDPFARRESSMKSGESPTATRNGDFGQESSGSAIAADAEDDTRTMAEVAYDTVNQPGFDFFLKAQAFTSRIISLDRYHRRRGTLETEFETLKDGQQINADLHTLWATRPTTMSFLRDPQGLETALQPRLARKILLNLRVYVANFYAQFIYLHRVAFKTYPSTTDVTFAIGRIISLVKDILEDAKRARECGSMSPFSDPPTQESDTLSKAPAFAATNAPESVQAEHDPDAGKGLPATMLWPLFLGAIEGTTTDRQFLLQTMRDMDMRHVRNAARTVYLLEEVLRRQDQEGRRVDHRSVRQEVFEGELSVLY